MATKTKDSSVVGKEKKAISSSSPITSTKKATTTTTTTKASTTNKPTSGPSEKQLPNYLKPTISSVHLDSRSFRLPRNNNDAATKPTLNRRRSFDPSSSRVPKQTPPSLSRQQKALVSPGPRDRTLIHRSSSVPSKVTTNSNASKPLPERLSKTPKEGRRTQPLVAKSTKKGSNNVSASSTKKVITDDASTNSTKADSKSTSVGETETTNDVSVETEPQVKEAINEDVVGEVDKVENQEELTRQVVDSEHDHDHEVHDQKLEESDERHDEGKVTPTVSEEQQEDGNTRQDESSHVENDHSTTEAEDEVKEEGVVEIEEDHKDESNNEGTVVEEKERSVEEGISEEVNNKLGERDEEDEQVEKGEGDEKDEQVENEVKEEKGESTKVEQVKASEEVEEKKESPSQISNDVIEETAGRLSEARRNRVRALAGAFQTVIDHQTK